MAKKNNAVEVENVQVTKYKARRGENSSLLAFATATVNGVKIPGIRIMNGRNDQPFVSLPSEKGKDGNWYNTIYLDLGSKELNAQGYSEISSAVLEEYEK